MGLGQRQGRRAVTRAAAGPRDVQLLRPVIGVLGGKSFSRYRGVKAAVRALSRGRLAGSAGSQVLPLAVSGEALTDAGWLVIFLSSV